jgi:hypothetical protein
MYAKDLRVGLALAVLLIYESFNRASDKTEGGAPSLTVTVTVS